MDRPDESPGPASNLLRSSVGLLGSFLSIAQTRVDLLTTELQEEVQRAGKMLLAAFAALLAAVLGLLLLGLSVVVFFWDTHRLGATLGVAAVFLGGAVSCRLDRPQRDSRASTAAGLDAQRARTGRR